MSKKSTPDEKLSKRAAALRDNLKKRKSLKTAPRKDKPKSSS